MYRGVGRTQRVGTNGHENRVGTRRAILGVSLRDVQWSTHDEVSTRQGTIGVRLLGVGNAQMELPEELWQRVLYPLPARTLLGARAVCRQSEVRVSELPVNYLDATQLFCILKSLSHSQCD